MARLLAGADRAAALSCLLAGGDDYELCFTAAPGSAPRVAAIAAEAGLPLTRIGAITAVGGLVVRDEYGAVVPAPRAFDHFAAGS
jgi:thiamine-monophosphate kinase